jgi:hypothetical protein
MTTDIDIYADAIVDKTNDLDFIMTFFGSDKGHPEDKTTHNYTKIYDILFNDIRNQPLRVFELGIGTTNLNVASNMGSDGSPGASLRGWKHYFPNAQIFGADIDEGCLFQEPNIQTFQCDQTNPESIKKLWENPDLTEGFDIIIEDGLHIFNANVTFFENSFHKLNLGGVFIIEDIMDYTFHLWDTQLEYWKNKYPHLQFRFYTIPFAHISHDNTVLIAKRIF